MPSWLKNSYTLLGGSEKVEEDIFTSFLPGGQEKLDCPKMTTFLVEFPGLTFDVSISISFIS